jgi:hypothetical protein
VAEDGGANSVLEIGLLLEVMAAEEDKVRNKKRKNDVTRHHENC